MKFLKTLFLFLLVFSIKGVLFSQNHPDDIVGFYLNEDPFSKALSQVYIYNAGNGTYEAIVVWVREEERKQYEGLVFMTGLTFNATENEWQNGAMIYPGKKGKFKAFMRLEKDGRLRVRGYWGVSMFGKTLYWEPEKESRNEKIKP
ncbi:MAG: DUF2147 domain-containing protein [Lentimicrobiaceae bacterium]|nr:DUF2147 domain-containing protein [Lentimicrobiaceae bacterium]